MKRFAIEYPDFPFLQVPLAKLKDQPIWQVALAKLQNEGENFIQVLLTQITWYHHISLLSKVNDDAERAYYIIETAQNGWSRDVMLLQITNGYMHSIGKTINNFNQTLPPPQSDLAKYIFKDPYNFSFLGAVQKVIKKLNFLYVELLSLWVLLSMKQKNYLQMLPLLYLK